MHAGDIAGARASLTAVESAAGADSGTWRRLSEFHSHLNQHEQAATCAIRVAIAQALRRAGGLHQGEHADRDRAHGRSGNAARRSDRAHARRRRRLVQPRDDSPPDARAQPRRGASRRARRPFAGRGAGRAALCARQGARGPRRIRRVLCGARAGRGGTAQGALLPGRDRRAGDRIDHPFLRSHLVRTHGNRARCRRADLRRRPAAHRHDARRADPDPARAGGDGRRGQRPRARGDAHRGPEDGQGRADQGGDAHRAAGARRVLLDRDPGLRAFAAVRRRQDAAQLPLPRPGREGAAAGAHRARAAPPDGVLLRDVQDAVPHGLPVLL